LISEEELRVLHQSKLIMDPSSSSLSPSSLNYTLFTVTLSLPSQADKICNRNNKKQSKKKEWEYICKQWGMVIARELVFRQNEMIEDDDLFEEEIKGEKDSSSNGINVNSSVPIEKSPSSEDKNNTIVIDGCTAVKVRDELIVTDLIIEPPSADNTSSNQSQSLSAAQNAGIQRGDIIFAIYGMQNPAFALLHGIMRDSVTFQ
jgi:hypothetical protein